MDFLTLQKQEQQRWQQFLPGFPESVPQPTFTETEFTLLSHFGFAPHYLPRFDMEQMKNAFGWNDRPHRILLDLVAQGRVSPAALQLPGRWLFCETRSKEAATKPWITKKELGFLEIFGLQPRRWLSTQNADALLALPRTCVSFHEIEETVSGLAKKLSVPENSIRLPHFLEYNILSTLWYPQWGDKGMWEWLEDLFGTKQRLTTGSGSVGIVGWDPKDHWSTRLSFRLLIDFP